MAQAKDAGVRHIVLISALGVNHDERAPLRVIEHRVMDSGIPYTILRPNFFMENFSEGSLAASIRGQSGIFLAAGGGKTSFISVRDVAAVALAAFHQPLTGLEFDLTGAEALDHSEAASIISEVSGRPVAYHPLSAGYAAAVTPDFERVTGRRPITFREFAQANAAAWE